MSLLLVEELLVAVLSLLSGHALGALQPGFYSSTCPSAEFIVSSVVREATRRDPRTPALLLRLHYHDCFVQGCDGSVLIQDPTKQGLEISSPNHAGVGGFDVIRNAKTELERRCQGVVSCADIVALAARDAVALSQGPFYRVPTGRRDGRVSNVDDAANMPDVRDSVQVLEAKFVQKGLLEKDLVLLTGAHTIGTAACFFIQPRLYDFLPGGGPDPLISPILLPELQSECPKGGDTNVRVPLDHGSGRKFDTKILKNIQTGFGVIESDAKLYTDPSMKAVIDSYVGSPGSKSRSNFGSEFVEAIVRMGQIEVKTGQEGEVRRVCSQFN